MKQQKQIKIFLQNAFGEAKAAPLFAQQTKILAALIGRIQNKTENQRKTLTETILPRIALYKALQQSGLSESEVNDRMQDYMLRIVAAQKHDFTANLEWIPGFYSLYSRIFLNIVRKSDLWESEQTHTKNTFSVTMKKCLWHTACGENGCPELCRLFCDVDNVTYGGLRKIGFTRTKTLGCGGDCCDFQFYKK